jgi:hypothetical protein
MKNYGKINKIRVYINTHKHLHLHLHIYIYNYIYKHRERERERERERDLAWRGRGAGHGFQDTEREREREREWVEVEIGVKWNVDCVRRTLFYFILFYFEQWEEHYDWSREEIKLKKKEHGNRTISYRFSFNFSYHLWDPLTNRSEPSSVCHVVVKSYYF